MAELRVTKGGLVNLRGVFLPVDDIRAMMLQTGGTVVSDYEINGMLDRAMVGRGKKGVDALMIDSIPDYHFLPVWMKIYNSPILDGIWIYFAVPKRKYV